MKETCPSCGAAASGRFCNACGAALNAACRECGNPLPAGARFCNECGTPAVASAATARRAPLLPWMLTGAAVVALVATLLFNNNREAPAPAQAVAAAPSPGPVPSGGPAAGNPGAVDLASMTPRQAADRLFNRVMQNVSSGDTAAAKQFLPMAVAAYDRARPLDSDGRYHLAVLHLVGGDFDAARAQSDTILSANPKHLFGLFTGAQAAQGRGDTAAAVSLYRRFLAAHDAEIARKDVIEYADHSQALPAMKAEAERATQ
jgi:tetratricopeptide (TPR) repeat protein